MRSTEFTSGDDILNSYHRRGYINITRRNLPPSLLRLKAELKDSTQDAGGQIRSLFGESNVDLCIN